MESKYIKGFTFGLISVGVFFLNSPVPLQVKAVASLEEKTMQEKAIVAAKMEPYLWQNRVLIIFAPMGCETILKRQNANLSGDRVGVAERDLVVWRVMGNPSGSSSSVSVDGITDEGVPSRAFYGYFAVEPDGFAVILLGKDGTEKLRQSEPVTEEELFGLIDRMPMRQREMQQDNP